MTLHRESGQNSRYKGVGHKSLGLLEDPWGRLQGSSCEPRAQSYAGLLITKLPGNESDAEIHQSKNLKLSMT